MIQLRPVFAVTVVSCTILGMPVLNRDPSTRRQCYDHTIGRPRKPGGQRAASAANILLNRRRMKVQRHVRA